MIRIDATGSTLTEKIAALALKETKAAFTEEAYPRPWETHLHPDQFVFMAKLKSTVFLPTNFQEKLNYPPVQFHGMKVIQDPSFPKNMIELRDARGKSLAAIVNLAV